MGMIPTQTPSAPTLMKKIVTEQARQHSDMAHFLVKHRNDVLAASGIGPVGFWAEMMKAAYKHAGEALHTTEPESCVVAKQFGF